MLKTTITSLNKLEVHLKMFNRKNKFFKFKNDYLIILQP